MSMIVDFHTHCFPETIALKAVSKLAAASRVAPLTDGTADGLSAAAREAGVDLSIVLPVATSPGQVSSINRFAAALNERTAETGLLSFGGAHPDDPDWREHLEQIAERGMKGVKIHPVYQGVDIDDARFVRLLSYAGELGLTVVAHAGDDIGIPGEVRCSPAMIRRAIRQAGPVTLVLAHMGGWRQWEQVAECLSDTGAYLDTSFSTGVIPRMEGDSLSVLDEEGFLRLAGAFGPERVLFGTDSPWSGQRESVDWLRALPLTEEEKAAILGGNAMRLLGMGACDGMPGHDARLIRA